MALTLAESAKLSTDMVLAGVIETIVKESEILSRLPFIEVVGNAVKYARENAAATVAWRAVGATWTEDVATYSEITKSLKIVGGDADVDKFLQATRSNFMDQASAVLQLKAKALAHEFEDAFVYGDDVSGDDPDGLHIFVNDIGAGQQVNQGTGTTAAALSLAKLDEMIDKVKPGKPDFLMMSRRTRRGLSKYARALTSPVGYEPGEFGQRVMLYDGIPILVNDFQLDTEAIASGIFSAKTGGSSSSIFAGKLGEGFGLAVFHNGGFPQVEDIGSLETKDATRWRVKAYITPALFSTVAIARLDGISSADVVA